jgi:hypothetical protein
MAKKVQQESVQVEEEAIDAGTPILSWETWEFPLVERSKRWYIAASAIGLFLILYALFTANFIFGVIVLMFAVITLLRDLKKPSRIPVHITTAGLVFGNDFYKFDEIRDFSLTYDPPEVQNLYVSFHGRLQPILSIDLEDMNPNEVRQTLLPFVFENLEREGESLTDVLRRVYKL